MCGCRLIGLVVVGSLLVGCGETPAGKVTGKLTGVGVGPVAVGEDGVWLLDSRYSKLSVSRINPRTVQLVGTPISLEYVANMTAAQSLRGRDSNIAVGEGAVWVKHGGLPEVTRIDPHSNEIAGTPIPVGTTGERGDLAVGEDAVWVSSTTRTDSTVTRIDPRSKSVAATIRLGPRFYSVFAIAAGVGAVWVLHHDEGEVVRIDPQSRSVAAVISAKSGGVSQDVATGEGAVWVYSTGRPSTVVRIDPRTNKVVGEPISLGARRGPSYGGVLAVGGGAVWAMENVDLPEPEYADVQKSEIVAIRIDPESNDVVGKPIAFDTSHPRDTPGTQGGAAFGEGALWVAGGEAVSRVEW